MKKREVRFPFACLLIALIIILSIACTAPQTAAPAAKPSTAPASSTAAPPAAAHPIVTLRILTAKVGTTLYAASFALADMLRKNHPWLKADALETLGTVDNCKTAAKATPADKKITIYGGVDSTYIQLMTGEGQFKGMATDIRSVANFASTFACLVTLNSKIKTKDDLIGKRVSAGDTKGSSSSLGAEFILTGMGIMDKLRLDYLASDEGWGALGDGLIDACYGSGTLATGKDKSVIDAALTELAATKSLYVIPFNKPDYENSVAKLGRARAWTEIPAGTLTATCPDKPSGSLLFMNGWMACPEMPEEYTYELAKFIAANANTFRTYYAQGVAVFPQMLAQGLWTEKMMHPGALKYYKEAKLPIGS